MTNNSKQSIGHTGRIAADKVKKAVSAGVDTVGAIALGSSGSRRRKALEKLSAKKGEIGWFAPRTWEFWRAVIICFCLMTFLGHLAEIPYCLAMNHLFGIVDESYPVWTDPWYHPYWVYGIGSVVMTLFLEPLKERIVLRRKTAVGALIESFVIVVVLAAALELIMGLIVNQPDAITGEYPYWDNSKLPGNILGQAWIVNDVFIGLAAMIYVWLVYPGICRLTLWLRPSVANVLLTAVVTAFAFCCSLSYWHLIESGTFS